MLPLIKEKLKSHQNAKACNICRKTILKKVSQSISSKKVQCHYTGKYRGAAHSICNLKFNLLNETPLVFHNDSNYDYHFII